MPPEHAPPARTHTCPTCGRRYVVVDDSGAEPRCACGEALTETSLASGVYELRRRPPHRADEASPPHAPMPREPDLGYGESHGYGPAHGGPSGPGDAPANEGPTSSPPRSRR